MFSSAASRSASAYKRVSVETSVDNADPHHLVSLLFDALQQALSAARSRAASSTRPLAVHQAGTRVPGCKVAIDTDAHAPGQLEWLPYGADKAVRCGVAPERIVNTRGADDDAAGVGRLHRRHALRRPAVPG